MSATFVMLSYVEHRDGRARVADRGGGPERGGERAARSGELRRRVDGLPQLRRDRGAGEAVERGRGRHRGLPSGRRVAQHREVDASAQ